MSLDVSPDLPEQARHGEVGDAAFRTGDHGAAYQEFISPRAQLLNQSPALRSC